MWLLPRISAHDLFLPTSFRQSSSMLPEIVSWVRVIDVYDSISRSRVASYLRLEMYLYSRVLPDWSPQSQVTVTQTNIEPWSLLLFIISFTYSIRLHHVFLSVHSFPTWDTISRSRFMFSKWSRLPSSNLVFVPRSLCHWDILIFNSKYMYNIVPFKKGPISLESSDTSALCGCKDPGKDWQSRWAHRRECHKLSYEANRIRNQSIGRSTPEMKTKCRTMYGTDHCECFTRKYRLYSRLRSWMPKGINYCGHCAKFTARKRGHNGRCKLCNYKRESELIVLRLPRSWQAKEIWRTLLDTYFKRWWFRAPDLEEMVQQPSDE